MVDVLAPYLLKVDGKLLLVILFQWLELYLCLHVKGPG